MIALMLAAAALSASAQEAPMAPKPGPEHDLLKARVGEWGSTLKAGGMEAKGSVTYKMDLGGLWLAGSMDSEMFGAKFTGRSLESFHPAKMKFVSVWVDSMATAPVTMEGTYDKESKTFTMAGEGPGMDGKFVKYKSVTKMPDKDTIDMAMWIGDGKEPMFTVTYKRKKK